MGCGNADKRGSTNLVFFSRISPYMVRETKRMTGKLELSAESTCRKHRGKGDCGRTEQKVRIIRKFSDKTKTIDSKIRTGRQYQEFLAPVKKTGALGAILYCLSA